MKVKCNGYDLAEAVIKVSKAISNKKNFNILESIKISAFGKTLMFSATDLDLSIQNIIRAEIMIEGDCLISNKTFVDFVRKLPAEEVVIDSTDNMITVSYSGNTVQFPAMDLTEYPQIIPIQPESSFIISVGEIKKIISKTIYAVATDDMRPIFKGCLFELKNKMLTVVALDGYRMSIYKTSSIQYDNDFSVIIPARSLIEITRLLGDDEENINVVFSDSKLMLDLTSTIIISRLIKGEFIKYNNIIPADFSLKVTVNSEQLKSVMDRVSIFSKVDKNNSVKFVFNDNLMSVSTKSDLVGNIEENIPVEMDGKETEITFNAKYIMDCLGSLSEEFVTINIRNSGSAATIIPIGNEDSLNLILPLRVSNA